MAEKLINGTFAGSLSGWSNIGTRLFAYVSGRARGTTAGSAENYFCLRQSFSISGAVISAAINASIWYASAAGFDTDGENRFVISLDKPGGTTVVLYEDTFIATTGNTVALSSYDIAAHLADSGTYYLRLALYSQAAVSGGTVVTSHGEYDNISVLVAEKFSKTVVEYLGAGELTAKKPKSFLTNIIGFVESLAHIGGEAGGNKTMASVNKAGFIETLAQKVKVTVLEVLGAAESLARTYSYCGHTLTDTVGLVETISARVTAGNITKIVTRFDTPAAWTERAPVDTDWEQTR